MDLDLTNPEDLNWLSEPEDESRPLRFSKRHDPEDIHEMANMYLRECLEEKLLSLLSPVVVLILDQSQREELSKRIVMDVEYRSFGESLEDIEVDVGHDLWKDDVTGKEFVVEFENRIADRIIKTYGEKGVESEAIRIIVRDKIEVILQNQSSSNPIVGPSNEPHIARRQAAKLVNQADGEKLREIVEKIRSEYLDNSEKEVPVSEFWMAIAKEVLSEMDDAMETHRIGTGKRAKLAHLKEGTVTQQHTHSMDSPKKGVTSEDREGTRKAHATLSLERGHKDIRFKD